MVSNFKKISMAWLWFVLLYLIGLSITAGLAYGGKWLFLPLVNSF